MTEVTQTATTGAGDGASIAVEIGGIVTLLSAMNRAVAAWRLPPTPSIVELSLSLQICEIAARRLAAEALIKQQEGTSTSG